MFRRVIRLQSSLDSKPTGSVLDFAHRNRGVRLLDVQNEDGGFLATQPRVVALKSGSLPYRDSGTTLTATPQRSKR